MSHPRSDRERHKDQVRRANKARYQAVKDLIAEYPDRYDELYAHYCSQVGVTPNPRPRLSTEELQAQIAELEARLRQQLGRAS